MIQTIMKHTWNANYGGATQYQGLFGGTNIDAGDWSASSTFGAKFGRTPMSAPVTFRNLMVQSVGLTSGSPSGFLPPTFTITLQKNGVDTSLATTVTSGSFSNANYTDSAIFSAGDDSCWKLSGSTVATPNSYDILITVEAETPAFTSLYGIAPFTGSVTAGAGKFGGAFGNGGAELYSPLVPDSVTYSISALAGAITRMDLVTFAGAPGAGTWTGYVRLNGVLQDGTGGTINTSCVMTGSATTATAAFSLPIAVQDHADLVILRSGTDAAFAVSQVAVGIAFVGVDDGAFMSCGGNNDALDTGATGWRWYGTEQLAAPEIRNEALIGPTGITIQGLYVEFNTHPPGLGHSWLVTLKQNTSPTTIALTVADTDTSGLKTGSVGFSHGDTVDLQLDPSGPPTNSEFHWGLALTSAAANPPAFTTTERVIRRLRRAPHIANQGNRVFHNRFLIDMQTGIGNVVDPGKTPEVMLRWSNNGGKTWSNEHWMSAGELGHYFTRVYATRLGQARDRIYEIVVSDPVAWTLIAAFIDLEPGTA